MTGQGRAILISKRVRRPELRRKVRVTWIPSPHLPSAVQLASQTLGVSVVLLSLNWGHHFFKLLKKIIK